MKRFAHGAAMILIAAAILSACAHNDPYLRDREAQGTETEPAPTGIDGGQDGLQSWAGAYEFYEFCPPDQNMCYTVTIYHENGAYYADVFIDGFQTLRRMRAEVQGDQESVQLVFLEYLPENIYEPFTKGDILLSFERRDSVLYTHWGEIQPLLPENADTETICFEIAEE